MLRASWSGDPMMNESTWLFRGKLHRESFEEALQHAMLKNPLFRCRVDWSVRGRPRWVLTDNRVKVYWDSQNPPERWSDDFDLTVELGIRVWVGPVSDGLSRISLRSHHAITDGIGVTLFWGDLLQRYSTLRSPPGAAMTVWRDSDPELLKLRNSVAPERKLLERVSEALKMIRFGRGLPPKPLAAPSSMATDTWADGKSVVTLIEGAGFDALRAFAKSRGVTLNDYLVSTLFRTLVAWNERHGSSNPADRLRIMVPTNGRDRRHAAMPAANCVGFSITNCTPADCEDPDRLLASVARQLREIRERHLGASYVDILNASDALARVRGKLVPRKRTRRSSRCEATAILSYFGDVDRLIPQGGARDEQGHYICGDITLIRSVGLVSRQDETRVGLTAHYHGNELVICLNPDRMCFDYAHASEFLELYKSQLLADARVEKASHSESKTLNLAEGA
jgi:hypothetical protein